MYAQSDVFPSSAYEDKVEAIIVSAIEEFLRDRHEYASHRFLVESIGTLLKSNVLSKLLELPELTAETIELAVKHWGSEVIYEFIRATGLLDVQCETRYGMVTKLAEENRKLRSEGVRDRYKNKYQYRRKGRADDPYGDRSGPCGGYHNLS